VQHAFAGLVMLADWLGSTRAAFPYAPPNGVARIGVAREAARTLVRDMGFDPGRFRRALTGPFEPTNATAPHPLRPVQQVMADAPLPTSPSVVVVESETGSGKTEAALIWFLRLFREGLVDGLYFAVPTRSAATQLHQRIVELLRRFAGDDAPPAVLAVPGYLKVDEAVGQRLEGFEVQWPDQAWARGWAAENSKRYLAGGVVVGTIDQALLSVLPVRHAHLRASALRRHLLVVDEVHASDAYMEGLLAGPTVQRPGEQRWGLLRQHLEAGGHALLLSATLGARTRGRLVAWRGGEVPDDARYPLVTWASADRTEAWAPKSPGSKEVTVTVRAWADEPERIAQRAAELAAQGARVLVLRNTVRDAVAVQVALEGLVGLDDPRLFRVEGVPAPHHARFAAADRERLDRAVEAAFGKEARGGARILVATQTVEQSLDLDADVLLTDLCPIDVLLQRLGRVHRHDREDRPTGFERARLELLVPTEPLSTLIPERGEVRGPHGWGRVYDDLRALQATWDEAQLAEAGVGWRIPDENRRLVEAGVDPDRLAALARDLGGRWASHEMVTIATELAHGRMAYRVIERRDRPFVDADLQWEARSTEDPELLVTRLGERDLEVEFAPPFVGPFGATVRRLRIPHHLARGIRPPTEPVSAATDGGGPSSFLCSDVQFVYDRHGLRRG
jgi:CRISPR-associated endonuclease/helicase Cas3